MATRASIAARAPTRGVVLALALAALAALPAAAREPLPRPVGEVLLVVSGEVGLPNVGDEAHLDLAALESLPRDAFSTRTPWADGVQHFAGVRLDVLLEALGVAPDTPFTARGIDDYEARFEGIDTRRYPVLLAYLEDGKPIGLRQLGPLRIVFPFDDHPELDTETNYAAAVWQLVEMELR